MKKIRCPCEAIYDAIKKIFTQHEKPVLLPIEIELGIEYGEGVRAEDE